MLGNALIGQRFGMDESAGGPDFASLNPVTRMGERVAALEESNKSLKSDTSVIRTTIHEINNQMQIFVAAEQACVRNLDLLTTKMSDHTEAIRQLTTARDQAYGVWWAIVRVCAVVSGSFTLLAALAGLIAWLLEHHIRFS